MSHVLEISEAAKRLGVDESTVRRMCAGDRLPGAEREGRRWVIPVSADPRLQPPKDSPLDALRDVIPPKRDEATRKLGVIMEFEQFAAKYIRDGLGGRSEAMGFFAREQKIGKSTLKLWIKLFREKGILGLVDTRGGRVLVDDVIAPEAFAVLKKLYLDLRQPTLKSCWKAVRRVNRVEGKNWLVPSYQATVRYCGKHISEPERILHREGRAAYEAKCAPYIETDLSAVEPGQIWVGDHHQFNCLVWHRGKWVRPWITAWEDLRSRMIVGRHVSLNPNQTTILRATKQAIDTFGPPELVKVDNGKDYDSETYTGTTKRRRKARKAAGLDERGFRGIYGLMGVDVSFAIPYHPQSKAIERWFDTLDSQFIKSMPTYCGKDAKRKPEDLAETLVDKSLAETYTLEYFTAFVDEAIAAYNAAPHTGKEMNGRSPRDVMDCRKWRRVLKEGVTDLLLRVWSPVLTVGKNGVQFRGMRYGQYDAEMLKNFGRDVRVGYDPEDIRKVHVHDAETWQLIAVAEQNQLVAYGAKVADEHVREGMRRKTRAARVVREAKGAGRALMMDLPTLTIQAHAEGQADTNPAPKKTPSLRPVATKLDGQEHEVVRRRRVRKAAGAESFPDVLDIDWTVLKREDPKPEKLTFDWSLLGKR